MIIGAFVLGIIVATTIYYLSPIEPLVADSSDTNSSVVGSSDIADIVDKTGSAVVLIETTLETVNNSDPLFNDPFFQEFFGGSSPQTYMQEGMGSGFIISKDGYILTNEHVIAGATKINVVMSGDGKEQTYEATVMGSDESLDLAVLKIKAKGDLPYLELGDSDAVRVGDWVIAIGNPYGLDHSTTVGVISAKGRPVSVEGRDYIDLLQTDASINPGNSGGPLLNMQGQVIGINTAVNSTAQGIGFAIPSSTVLSVLDNLKSGKNPWVGVYIQPLTSELSSYLGIEQTAGILVAEVVDNSPAQIAGIQKGDIIKKANDQEIASTSNFTNIVSRMEIGTKLNIEVLRSGQTKEITVVVDSKS